MLLNGRSEIEMFTVNPSAPVSAGAAPTGVI